jgi:hypothetical protein
MEANESLGATFTQIQNPGRHLSPSHIEAPGFASLMVFLTCCHPGINDFDTSMGVRVLLNEPSMDELIQPVFHISL